MSNYCLTANTAFGRLRLPHGKPRIEDVIDGGRGARRHLNDKPEDFRHAGQRDRDRILYSSAFRRLDGVTQVVAANEGHVFHNRLTHTLKVAQVSQRLGQKAAMELAQQGADDPSAWVDPDVCEAAALAHDLGHPPFGHVAEEALHGLAREEDPADGFEGNAQSFRIVTKLACSDASFPGLNLSRATLNAILKYPWIHDPSDPDSKAHDKWGAFHAEMDDLAFARSLPGPSARLNLPVDPGARSLEAQIMDWSDDIAYAVHDVEDHYRAGLVPLDRLSQLPHEREAFAAWVLEKWTRDRRVTPPSEQIQQAMGIIELSFGAREPYTGSRQQRIAVRTFTSMLVGRYVRATRFEFDDAGPRMVIDDWAKLEVEVLKELIWRYVIDRPGLATQQHGQVELIKHLYRTLMDAATAEKESTSDRLLPELARYALQDLRDYGLDQSAVRSRVVCDVICSLTEDQAVRLYRRLTGLELGRVGDLLL